MDFKQIQQSFIDYIKDPSQALPLGTEQRHMQVYRDLFYNNVHGFVSNAFPVLKSLHTASDWDQRVNLFFAHHDCHSPLFVDIAGEFMQFLQQQPPSFFKWPFELELAHYEWQELVVAVAANEPQANVLLPQEVADYVIRLAPFAVVLSYHYPVQHISQDFIPQTVAEQPQHFCIYRDHQDQVQFLQLTQLAAQALFILQQQPASLTYVSDALAQHYPSVDPVQIQQGLMSLLSSLAELGILRKSEAVG
ncbi:DUF2063 domain-containing protein [Shewanella sp. NIFS-20-20]|uniref:HvfC family RiPP maturation protein n=1 Tax=Shewanella sp. NIFS-20-20 TaxID=2853806 RepID=UPI001C44495A|nr:putative DNA-binding domain-containing protein [Shewanella sp. NIFS-20-20]MBV7315150.1 putative DNA-binding domain-containing protein [Shewanella sp. NIFS-20-20]